jgi:hypothetical protein
MGRQKEPPTMRIKYLNNSVEDHVERNLGQSLIRAGLAVAVGAEENSSRLPKYQPASAPAPQWEVCVHTGIGTGEKVLCIRMTLPHSVVDYFGPPENANAVKRWDGGQRFLNGFGCAVPDDILKQYKRSYKENPNLRGAGVAMPLGFTGGSNDSMASEKEAYDKSVASGCVPFSAARG